MKLIYNYPQIAGSGGSERILTQKANYFANVLNYEVIIITTDQRGRKPFFGLSDKIHHIDLNINYDLSSYKKSFLKSFFLYRKKLKVHRKKLTEILINEKCHIVSSFYMNEKEFLYKIKDGSKKILESHNSHKTLLKVEFYSKKNWLEKMHLLYRMYRDNSLIKYYDAFVVLTNEDKLMYNKPKNIHYIPNPTFFKPEKCAFLENKQVLFVGYLSFRKGTDRMLEIWSQTIKNNSGWNLLLVGDISDNYFLKQIKELNIENNVRIIPPTSNVWEYYLNSSIFIMTSRFEGLPMVLLEAQACGLPVVSYTFKCGPKDVIIDGENGFLVQENDKDTFIEKLSILMTNEALRKKMGALARENSQKYEMQNIMSQWNELFLSLSDN